MTEDEMYDIIRGYEESELDYHERNIELENENEKLRELVRHLYVCNQRLWIDNGVCVCALCPYLEYDCEFEQRILNLGIEVQP